MQGTQAARGILPNQWQARGSVQAVPYRQSTEGKEVSDLTVASISAEALVKRAVMNARPRTCGESPRWVAVMDTFALGSTYATQLCAAHGLDPDEMISGLYCEACETRED